MEMALKETVKVDGRLIICDPCNVSKGTILPVKPGTWMVEYVKDAEDSSNFNLPRQIIKSLSLVMVGETPVERSPVGQFPITSSMAAILSKEKFSDLKDNDYGLLERCDDLCSNLMKNPEYIPFKYPEEINEQNRFDYYKAQGNYLNNRRVSQEFILDISPAIIDEAGVITTDCCSDGLYPIFIEENKDGDIVKVEIQFYT